MSLARIPGARLSYVVVDLADSFPDGKVTRNKVKMVPGKGLVHEPKEEDAGFLVYSPRGHVLRIKNRKMLEHYNLHLEPRIINMSGLADPNSPLGKMMMSQDDKQRRGAYEDLEKMVIRLATAKTGTILMPEQLEQAPSAEEAEAA